MVSQDLISI